MHPGNVSVTLTRSRSRIALLIAALVGPLLVWSVPATAADPIPTTSRIFSTPPPASAPSYPLHATIKVRVTSASGVPKGSVKLIRTDTGVLTATVPLDATGLATAVLPCEGQGAPFCGRYRAEFTGTDGYADSADAPGDNQPEILNPEPTIVKFGGPGLLKLYLTTAVTITFPDGTPVEGTPITFTLLGPLTMPGHGTPLLEVPVVCTAWSDANGLASCGGQAAAASILSVLTGAWANRSLILSFNSVKLPVVTVVK